MEVIEVNEPPRSFEYFITSAIAFGIGGIDIALLIKLSVFLGSSPIILLFASLIIVLFATSAICFLGHLLAS